MEMWLKGMSGDVCWGRGRVRPCATLLDHTSDSREFRYHLHGKEAHFSVTDHVSQSRHACLAD